MFIATKYEDIVPLLMRTILNKIGHNKFTKQQIEDQEMKMLKTLGFKLSAPTTLEFLERYLEECGLGGNAKLKTISMYLAKMTVHDYELSQLPASQLAASSLFVALRIMERVDASF